MILPNEMLRFWNLFLLLTCEFAPCSHVLSSAARLYINCHSQRLLGGTAARSCAGCEAGQTTHKSTTIRRLLRKQSVKRKMQVFQAVAGGAPPAKVGIGPSVQKYGSANKTSSWDRFALVFQKRHHNLWDLWGVGDPALLNVEVRNMLQNRDEARQQEDIDNSEVPHWGRHRCLTATFE